MSYAICTVVCGCELPNEIREYFEEIGFDYGNLEVVTEQYTSGGDGCYYCGVELCEFDECKNIPVGKLKLSPTDKQIASAVKKMQKLAEQVEKEFNHIESQQVEEDRKDKKYLKTLLESIPKKPEVILMWSSS